MFILESKTQPGVFVYESEAGPSMGYVEFYYAGFDTSNPPDGYAAYKFTEGSDRLIGSGHDFFNVLASFNSWMPNI